MNDPVQHAAGQALITGVYRSGTEFVTQLLSGHPALSATMYHVNGARFLRGRYEPLSDPAQLELAVGDTAARLAERYDIALETQAVLAACAARSVRTWTRLYDVIMSALWLGDGRSHWVEKCQLVWCELPEFLTDMPDARAIIVVRDPRSVLASFKRYTYAAAPAYLGAIFNCLDVMARGRALAAAEPERVRVVRYEDAARAPDDTARLLAGFLGLDPAQTDVDPAGWHDAAGLPWRKNTVFESDGEPFAVQKAIHRWRDHLDSWETGFVETVCGAEMDAHGYERSGTPVDWPASLRAILSDAAMTAHLYHWLETGQGIQAFPTDPLKRANWEENAATAANG